MDQWNSLDQKSLIEVSLPTVASEMKTFDCTIHWSTVYFRKGGKCKRKRKKRERKIKKGEKRKRKNGKKRGKINAEKGRIKAKSAQQ